jgi:NADH-quinone oxidoreductase subunit E
MQFSDTTRARAAEIIARYPQGRERSALLPLLHLVQSEEGYVSPDGVAFCAEILGITKAQVGAVATFYTMYKRRPTGDWLISVCTNTMCGVLGGNEAYQALSEHLDVGHDETTADGTITLEHAECLAACDYAPVMTVNYEFFDRVDAQGAMGIVKQLQSGERPQPSRGVRLCTMKEMGVQLAGFADARVEYIGDGPAGEPTLAGNRLAEQYNISVAGFDPDAPITKRDDAKAGAPPAAAGHREREDRSAARTASRTDEPGNVKPATAPQAASDGKPAGDGPVVQDTQKGVSG